MNPQESRYTREADQLRVYLSSYGWSIVRAAGTMRLSIPAAYRRVAPFGGVSGLRRHGVFQVHTGRDVARLFAVHPTQVSQWIRWGLFSCDEWTIHRNMSLLAKRRSRNRQWLIPDRAVVHFVHSPATWMLWHPDRMTDPDWRTYTQDLRPQPARGTEWLTACQVATRWGCSVEHARRRLRAGGVPTLRYGKQWYVWHDDNAPPV